MELIISKASTLKETFYEMKNQIRIMQHDHRLL